MAKNLFLIVFILVISIQKLLACDCYYNGSFLKMSKDTKLIALVRIIKYNYFKTHNEDTIAISMKVEMIEKYKGEEKRDTLTIWGDNGFLCRP